jgi:integrase
MKAIETKDRYIKRQPDGTFNVRVSVRLGKQIVSRKKGNLLSIGEARRTQSEFIAELETRKKHFKQGGLWGQALEKYLQQAGQQLSPKTYEDVQTSLRHHTQGWENLSLAGIATPDIHALFQGTLRDCERATRKKVIGYISRVFKHYVEMGRIHYNPATGVKFHTKAKGQEKLIAMNREEIVLLLEKAKEFDHGWYPNWLLAYQTGMRSGELYALEWRQVDFKNKLITVDKSFNKHNPEAPTKNRETRVVAINNATLNELRRLKLTEQGSDRYVLKRNKEWEHGKASKIIKSFQEDLGIRKTNFHSLRASFITHLLLEGVPVTKVQKMVGHGELKTTERYVRLCGSDIKGATSAIDMEILAV